MTIDTSAPGDVIELSDDFDFDGYQVVRREFFAHTFEPSITFNNYKVYVNTACLNKFPHADCAQLLINQESRILALRPCAESERDAFSWCNTSGGRRKPRQVTGKFFFAKLFELMNWNIDYRYKLLGKVIHANGEYLIAFDLNASEIYQRIAKDGGKPKTAHTPVFPAGWKDQFGLPYHEHQKSLQINIFDGYVHTAKIIGGNVFNVHIAFLLQYNSDFPFSACLPQSTASYAVPVPAPRRARPTAAAGRSPFGK